jgi:hypothetical protein
MCRHIFRLILRPVSALSLVFSMMGVVVVGGVLVGAAEDVSAGRVGQRSEQQVGRLLLIVSLAVIYNHMVAG